MTSMDHYAEGLGKTTCWTLFADKARAAHNQTTERRTIITQLILITK
jgi:hypothetical protein